MSGANAEGDVPQGDRVRDLEDELKWIAADLDRASTDDGRRGAGLQQLMAITLCLQREGIPGEALRPVTAVMHGLIDLDRGNVPPILQTQRRAGGRSIPFDDLHQRGLAAATVTLLMRADEAGGA